jgi:hypothetical protein
VAPHHGAGIAHETAEIGHRRVVRVVELAPAHARPPRGDGALDGGAVERGGASQERNLSFGFHGAGEHERVVRLHGLHSHGSCQGEIVEPGPAAFELELGYGALQCAAHVE